MMEQQENICMRAVHCISNKSSTMLSPPRTLSPVPDLQCDQRSNSLPSPPHRFCTVPHCSGEQCFHRLRLPACTQPSSAQSDHAQHRSSANSCELPAQCASSCASRFPSRNTRIEADRWSRRCALVPSLSSIFSSLTSSLFLTTLLLCAFMLHTAGKCHCIELLACMFASI